MNGGAGQGGAQLWIQQGRSHRREERQKGSAAASRDGAGTAAEAAESPLAHSPAPGRCVRPNGRAWAPGV